MADVGRSKYPGPLNSSELVSPRLLEVFEVSLIVSLDSQSCFCVSFKIHLRWGLVFSGEHLVSVLQCNVPKVLATVCQSPVSMLYYVTSLF